MRSVLNVLGRRLRPIQPRGRRRLAECRRRRFRRRCSVPQRLGSGARCCGPLGRRRRRRHVSGRRCCRQRRHHVVEQRCRRLGWKRSRCECAAKLVLRALQRVGPLPNLDVELGDGLLDHAIVGRRLRTPEYLGCSHARITWQWYWPGMDSPANRQTRLKTPASPARPSPEHGQSMRLRFVDRNRFLQLFALQARIVSRIDCGASRLPRPSASHHSRPTLALR